MILSEYDRRWAEVRFYQFIAETYEVRHNIADITTYADAICNMGDADNTTIKSLIKTMLSDTYYTSSRRDLILLAHKKGLSTVKIGNYLDITRQGVSKYIKAHIDNYDPLPRCGIDEDYELIKFLKTLDNFNSIGNFGNGTIN